MSEPREYMRRRESVLVGLALSTSWFQPLILLRTGIPVASAVFAGVAIVLALSGRAGRVSMGTPVWGLLYLGLVWAAVVSMLKATNQPIVTWGTLVGSFLFGALLIQREAIFLRSMRLAGLIGTASGVCAAAYERFADPTLGGIISADPYETRLPALHYNPNGGAASLVLAMVLLFCGGLGQSTAARNRVMTGILLTCGCWALFLTGSQGAMAGLLAASAVWVLRVPLRVLSVVVKAIIVTGGAILATYLGAFGSAASLAQESFAPRLDASFVTRQAVWSQALRALESSPWTGVLNFSPFPGVDNAHNGFLETALDFGYPGLAIVVCLVAAVAISLSSTPGRVSTTGLMVLGATVVYSVTHVGLLDNALAWIVIGASTNLSTRPHAEPPTRLPKEDPSIVNLASRHPSGWTP